MTMVGSEQQLIAILSALVSQSGAALTKTEAGILTRARKPAPRTVKTMRDLIRAGADPLGEAFSQIRTPSQRRSLGATYTPPAIVTAMTDWAIHQAKQPGRIVDPGAGSGRFLMAAAPHFPEAELVAVEVDPLATLMLRANAKVLGFDHRLTVKLADYRRTTLKPIDRPTLYIGNPPYVRHHDLSESAKAWFAATAKQHGFTASKLAGLHLHFFLKTRTLARPGDFGAFITAAEWIDVNYGKTLRQMLADGLGGTSLHLLSANVKPFADALTTGAITCFEAGSTSASFAIRKVETLNDLAPLSDGKKVAWSKLKSAPKWSVFLSSRSSRPKGHIEIGELFRVHRGQVTGANNVFVAGPDTPPLPARFLYPTITRAHELFAAPDALTNARHLRKVIDLPINLDRLIHREDIQRFLDWAKAQGADQSYIARHRKAWWSVGLKPPAPIICTYMARRPPVFVRNYAGVRHINIAHGLYPRVDLTEQDLDRIARYLTAIAFDAGGRVYAGGLTKFEPKEIERLALPALSNLEAA